MGLDMYLTKKTYLGYNYEHRRNEDGSVPISTGGEAAHIKPERISEISEQIGYWRKANAIHNWFVENIQGNEDNCGEYEITKKDLKALLDAVNTVLQDCATKSSLVVTGYRAGPDTGGEIVPVVDEAQVIEDTETAEEILPTKSGLFFGGTEYTADYIEDLKDTKEIIENAISEVTTLYVSIYYSSSW